MPPPSSATCHCGAVRIDVEHPPTAVTECNCSICRRYGVRWAYYTTATARVIAAPGALASYIWGDRHIAFQRCATCGCVTHYEGLGAESSDRVAVNARMMPPEVTAGVPIRRFDGAETWRYLDSA